VSLIDFSFFSPAGVDQFFKPEEVLDFFDSVFSTQGEPFVFLLMRSVASSLVIVDALFIRFGSSAIFFLFSKCLSSHDICAK